MNLWKGKCWLQEISLKWRTTKIRVGSTCSVQCEHRREQGVAWKALNGNDLPYKRTRGERWRASTKLSCKHAWHGLDEYGYFGSIVITARWGRRSEQEEEDWASKCRVTKATQHLPKIFISIWWMFWVENDRGWLAISKTILELGIGKMGMPERSEFSNWHWCGWWWQQDELEKLMRRLFCFLFVCGFC